MSESIIVIPFVTPPSALAAVLAEVMDRIMPTIKWERCGVVLAHAVSGALEFLALRGMYPGHLLDYEFQLSHEIIRHVFSTQTPLLTDNGLFHDHYYHRSISVLKYRLRSVLVAPLIVRNDTIGVIYCDCSVVAGVFMPEDFEPFVAIANRAAVTIEQARQIDPSPKLMMQGNQRAMGSDEDDGI